MYLGFCAACVKREAWSQGRGNAAVYCTFIVLPHWKDPQSCGFRSGPLVSSLELNHGGRLEVISGQKLGVNIDGGSFEQEVLKSSVSSGEQDFKGNSHLQVTSKIFLEGLMF